ncbi:hypothetical protein D1007_18770 [Hordeum vulgare]|nr:hypothetical protein D1007_18770 [Hordeum vulgare]
MPAEHVATRTPGAELVPALKNVKVVIFAKHFSHGFGLPVSILFWRFLTHFGLKLHHLGRDTVVQLATFIALSQGYIGAEPLLELYCRLFYLNKHTLEDKVRKMKNMSTCRAALVYVRLGAGFPKLLLHESAKKWQCSFFYVKNVDSPRDFMNLPLRKQATTQAAELGDGSVGNQ